MELISVANFDQYASGADLVKLFSRHGKAIKADVLRTDSGRSFRRGFVYMENEDEAKRAVLELNGKYWRGYRLKVSLAK